MAIYFDRYQMRHWDRCEKRDVEVVFGCVLWWFVPRLYRPDIERIDYRVVQATAPTTAVTRKALSILAKGQFGSISISTSQDLEAGEDEYS